MTFGGFDNHTKKAWCKATGRRMATRGHGVAVTRVADTYELRVQLPLTPPNTQAKEKTAFVAVFSRSRYLLLV